MELKHTKKKRLNRLYFGKKQKQIQTIKSMKTKSLSTRMDRNLIFDLGLHKGLDSRNYLAKGFQVVGLEAIPTLCQLVRDENQEALASGQLTVVERALWRRSRERATFYVNTEHDDWGSLDRGAAEKGVSSSLPINVETITLSDLFSAYGNPYYIKCDLEGGDAIFIEQLLEVDYRPSFVSIEATSADDLAMLRACGYQKFQIVNQWMNSFTKAPNPAREGKFADLVFNSYTSGLFGRELPPNNWMDFSSMMRNFCDWYDLHKRDQSLAIGWLDVHATNKESLV